MYVNPFRRLGCNLSPDTANNRLCCNPIVRTYLVHWQLFAKTVLADWRSTATEQVSRNIHLFNLRLGLMYLSYERTQTSSLTISPQLFHSKLKTLLFSKSNSALSSSPYPLAVSTSNTIHHNRLTLCLLA